MIEENQRSPQIAFISTPLPEVENSTVARIEFGRENEERSELTRRSVDSAAHFRIWLIDTRDRRRSPSTLSLSLSVLYGKKRNPHKSRAHMHALLSPLCDLFRVFPGQTHGKCFVVRFLLFAVRLRFRCELRGELMCSTCGRRTRSSRSPSSR